jgi:hypothetical protein
LAWNVLLTLSLNFAYGQFHVQMLWFSCGDHVWLEAEMKILAGSQWQVFRSILWNSCLITQKWWDADSCPWYNITLSLIFGIGDFHTVREIVPQFLD